MGGLDILFSRIKNGKFQTPENIGCPVNTEGDEFGLIVTPSGLQAIYSSSMAGGFGGKDLYIFDLYPEAQPVPITFIKGRVLSKSTSLPVESEIVISDLRTSEQVSATTSDISDGSFLLSVPLDADYALSIVAKDFMLLSENITIADFDTAEGKLRTFYLQPIVVGADVVLRNVFFDIDSYRIMETSLAELNTLLDILKSNPRIKIEISGHTDNTGSPQHNDTLSQFRAEAIRDWLVLQEIDNARLTAKGYGSAKPVSSNETAEGRSLNRRTEFRITAK
jgi:hypothetical protein